MKVLTIGQRKGGNCKSTAARYMSEYLARFAGQRVLTIDLDNQCNLSSLLLNMEGRGDHIRPPEHPDYDPIEHEGWDGRCSSADLIRFGEGSTYPVTKPKAYDNWEILPGDSQKLFRIEREEAQTVTLGIAESLRRNLDVVFDESKPGADGQMDPQKRGFDVVVIDTGPSGNSLMRAAIRAATHVLIPFTPDPQSTMGLSEMVGLIRNERRTRPSTEKRIETIGLWPWRVRGVRIHDDAFKALSSHEDFASLLLPFQIPERIVFQELDSPTPNPSSVFDLNDSKNNDLRDLMMRACEAITHKLLR